MANTNRYPVPRGGYNPSPSRPIPANDNRPRVRPPMPANDNVPGGWRPRVPLGPMGRRAAYMMAARSAARFVPVVGAILTAHDLLQLARYVLGMLELPRRVPQGFTWEPCNPPPQASFAGYATSGNTCGNWNETFTPPGNVSLPIASPYASFYEWGKRTQFPRFIRIGRYARTGAVAPPVWPRPRTFVPMPYVIPSIDPLTPPGLPRAEPVPQPVRRPDYDPFPNPETDVPPEGYHPPRGRIESAPLSGPRPQQAQRPGRNTKERKVIATSKARKLMGWALSQYSEVGDLVDALYDALPDEVQSNSDKTIADKFKRMYDNWDKVDMAEAMGNIVYDQVTDPKFAEQFKRMQDVFEGYGIEVPDLRGTSGSSGPW